MEFSLFLLHYKLDLIENLLNHGEYACGLTAIAELEQELRMLAERTADWQVSTFWVSQQRKIK